MSKIVRKLFVSFIAGETVLLDERSFAAVNLSMMDGVVGKMVLKENDLVKVTLEKVKK